MNEQIPGSSHNTAPGLHNLGMDVSETQSSQLESAQVSSHTALHKRKKADLIVDLCKGPL